jgi:cold shock CspA family protein
MSNASAAGRSQDFQDSQHAAIGKRSRELDDEIRYCERCGISYLWSIEEQRTRADAGAPAPEHCPGCRVLLPPPARTRGLVKWYNIRKRYGFIVRQGEPEIFVPAAALQGARFLQTGDLVEFSLGQNQEGPIAQDVILLQRDEALLDKPR